jgi:D-beta-D-heptose 7-phosphate kinase/D-beta-D-heptose 1-phosphate adenosyltransferase
MAITAAAARALLKKIQSLRILVIGDVMLDHYILGDATRISPEAPVPVVDVEEDRYTAGGAGNVALNIASLGARSSVAGFFGTDEAGLRLVQILKEKNVATLSTPGTGRTIVKTRVLVQKQQMCRLDREDAPVSYQVDSAKIETLLGDAIANSDAIILSDYAKGLLDDALVAKVTQLAHAAKKFVALDPKPKRPMVFADIDLITPNRREAARLAGVSWLQHTPFPEKEICRVLHEKYRTRNLVITMSEDGVLLSQKGKVLKRIPTAAREVADVSGAGDTSIAGLVLALAAGAKLETAAHFANAAAGVVVGKLGTATVTPDELIQYVSRG